MKAMNVPFTQCVEIKGKNFFLHKIKQYFIAVNIELAGGY